MIRRSSGERRPPSASTVAMFSSARGKKVWTIEEDEALRKLVDLHGTGNWTLIAQSLPERTGKQCRERFHNHLDQGIKKGDWTEEEDRIIIILQRAIGNQWAKITKMLPGRTDNAVKNRFHATERAKSRGKLDETFLNDPVYTDYIIKEALRVNGELNDGTTSVASVSTMESERTHMVKVEPAKYATSFPVATASFAQTSSVARVVSIQPFGSASQDIYDVDDEEDDDEDDEEEEEGEGDVNGLMDLDIISFDSEDMDDFLEDDQDTKNLDCFNFDWNCSSFLPGNNATSPMKTNNVGQGNTLNLCGLETWAMGNRPQNAIPLKHEEYIPKHNNMPPVHHFMGQPQPYPQQQPIPQHHQFQQPQPQYGLNGHAGNNNNYFFSR